MANQPNVKSTWEQCPAGEIGGMVRRIKGRRRKVLTLQLAGGAVFGMLIGLTCVTYFSKPDDEYKFGAITCAEVRENAEAYIAGRLDADLRARIKAHLQECPACRPRFRKTTNEQTVRVTLPGRVVSAFAVSDDNRCPHDGHVHMPSNSDRVVEHAAPVLLATSLR